MIVVVVRVEMQNSSFIDNTLHRDDIAYSSEGNKSAGTHDSVLLVTVAFWTALRRRYHFLCGLSMLGPSS